MSMKKTLGGDRLGTGNNMKVDLHGYERSTHDKGYVFRSTMSCGTLVPFIKEIALPGDSFDIDLNCDIKTHPTVGPLFGTYKVQLDVFTSPIRLYQGQLHNNKLEIGRKMNTVKLPIMSLRAPNTYGIPLDQITDPDNYQINPSCILSYFGIRGIGTNRGSIVPPQTVTRNFQALYLLAYWDIYKNYYSNKQEEIGVVIHTELPNVSQEVVTLELDGTAIPALTGTTPVPLQSDSVFVITRTLGAPEQDIAQVLLNINGITVPLNTIGFQSASTTTTQDIVFTNLSYLGQGVYFYTYPTPTSGITETIDLKIFDLNNIDSMREAILAWTTNMTAFDINANPIEPYSFLFEEDTTGTFRALTSSQEGLGIKTYQSDLLNNWLSTDWIDGAGGISELTAIDTTSGEFTIDTLNINKKVYDMLNRIAVSGGTYDDWQDAVWAHNRYTRTESPVYHGGLIKELVFQEVVSNSQATGEEGSQPLGTLAGKGIMGHKHKGGQINIKVDEPSIIIGIVSLTPRLDYSQGNDWDTHLMTMDDFHKPALDQIGFQELITEQMAWWDTFWDEPNNKWITKSAGKQPAWINYMTNINKVRGNFAVKDNEMFMVLNRNYKPELTGEDISIQDLTTYVDPRIYNQIFADTSLDSQNFWAQIGVDMIVRRKMSAKIMPNL